MRASTYVWKSSGEPLTVTLAMDVIQRLGLAAMEAFKAVPRRGLEIGGILLGRVDTDRNGTRIDVLDFEALDSEHRSGPSYRLSEADLRTLDEALARRPEAVGLFRTQTRANSLELEEDDEELFRHCFEARERLFLLVQPSLARAAFFMPADRARGPIHEFRFRAADLAPAPVTPATTAEAARPARATDRRSRWTVPVLAGGLGILAGAAILHFEPRSSPAARPTAAVREPEHVALKLERDGGALRLLWDRNSPTIRGADRATLVIIDGTRRSQLNLDARELTTGSLAYWPESGDVSFRLETFAGGRRVTDSIRAAGTVAAAAAPPSRTAALRDARTAAPKPKPAGTVEAPRAEETPPAAPRKPEEVSEARPSPFQQQHRPEPAAERTQLPAPAPAAVAVPPAVRPPEPTAPRIEARISVEPVAMKSSGLGNAIGKIPLLRRLRKPPAEPFVPPEPVHRVEPALNAAQRRSVTRPVAIDVKVYVTKTGKVDYAELLTDASPSNYDLAGAAVYAAHGWSFTPARLGEEKVRAEVILHFRFQRAE